MAGTLTPQVEFAPHFRGCRIHPVRDQALMKTAHALRFDVYCTECGFLPASDYPDRIESDSSDADSAHFGALNAVDALVGYVRLARPDADQLFPFQRHGGELFAGLSLPQPGESGEISRLMVRQDYRRRRGDILAGITVDDNSTLPERERRDNSPQILLSLYRQMYLASLANNIRYWYAAMERSLARALTRMSFAFTQIGPQTDYYGPVAPYIADLRELEAHLGMHNPPLLAWMQMADPTRR